MTTARKPWRNLLGWFLCCFLLPRGAAQSCSSLAMNSSAVLLGGSISANCTIWKRRCLIEEDNEVHIQWKWAHQILRGTQRSAGDGVEVSSITVGPVNQTANILSCWLERNGNTQIMNMIQINAGYPPSEPQNLTCIMNITTMSLTCQWDPGEDSHLPVKVALKGVRSGSECNVHLQDVPLCVPLAGQNSCSIPRKDLFLYRNMVFWVSAENVLGAVESRPLCADPMDLVKLDPPVLQEIQSLPEDTDCMSMTWERLKGSEYIEQACELRYRLEEEHPWTSVYKHNITTSTWGTELCGVLFATRYWFQMRCQRLPAGYWSDWSPTKNFTTQEKAPSGMLDTWWKVKTQEAGGEKEVQLLWKPMKPSDAHGKILGYMATLSATGHIQNPTSLCNTTALQCTFSLPPGSRQVLLTAYNSRGASQPTKVSLLEKKGQPLPKIWTSPYDGKSLWVHWDPPGALSATGYIIEWHQVTSADPSEDNDSMRWTKVDRGTTTRALIQEGFEPFQRYNISIYPLYSDAVGMPRAMEAYTLQKAPSEGPRPYAGNLSKSTAEVHWEPIPVEKQHGFIVSYTIFWTGTSEDMSSAVVNSSIHTFTLKGLWPSRLYQVHIMASTVSGSTNGTVLMLHTKATDDLDLTFLYVVVVLLLTMIIILVCCFHKSKGMKTQFWPSVPDPANSSLGKWAPAVLQEESPPPPLKPCELSPVIVSAILVLEADEKKCLSCKKTEPGKALEDSSAAFHISYLHDANTGALPNRTLSPAPYINSPESGQYARVMGDSYRSQREAKPTFYMRSESTQPLLCNTTPSPKPYENLWFHSDEPNQKNSFQEESVFLERALLDFPLLQGLRIEGADDLRKFRRL